MILLLSVELALLCCTSSSMILILGVGAGTLSLYPLFVVWAAGRGLAIEPWHPEPWPSQSTIQCSGVSKAFWFQSKLSGDSMPLWRDVPQYWHLLDQIKSHLLAFRVGGCVMFLTNSGLSSSSDGKPFPLTTWVLASQTNPRALMTDLKRRSLSFFVFCFHQEAAFACVLGSPSVT